MFKLTLHRPKFLGAYDPEDTSVSEAIYSIYEVDDGELELDWNGCKIFLTLNGFSDIYNDIENMLEQISLGRSFVQHFLCSAFTATWVIKIASPYVEVTSSWVAVSGGALAMEELKNSPDSVIMLKDDFVKLWNDLLISIRADLKAQGYQHLI